MLGTSSVPDPGDLIHGWCLSDLGQPDAAADLLADRLATVPAAGRRTRARFGARLALAHAGAGDVPVACRTTTAVLADAHRLVCPIVRLEPRDVSDGFPGCSVLIMAALLGFGVVNRGGSANSAASASPMRPPTAPESGSRRC